MNKVWKALKLILNIVVAVVVGTVLIIAVYCLPVESMREHVLDSNMIQYKETDVYYWAPGVVSSKLDGFTDSLMLNNAVFSGSGSVVKDAMNNPYVIVKDMEQSKGLVKYLVDDSLETQVVNYPRYWHGYLVWLKPLLMIMSYADIRIVFMFLQGILAMLTIIELYKYTGYRGTVPFGFMLLCMNPISTAMCMQYACMYTITLAAAYIMLKFKVFESSKYLYFFLWIGICTAFFDFLTYPVVGLGVSLILFIMLGGDRLGSNIRRIVLSSISWLCGYAGMWIGKWIVAYILTGNNVLKDGFGAALYRSAGDSMEELGVSSSSAGSVIRNNVEQLLSTPLLWVIALLIIVLIGLLLLRILRVKIDIVKLASFAVVGLYPFVWYSVIRNHSAVHSWMTHRNLAVTIFAIAAMITYSMYRDSSVKLTLKRKSEDIRGDN